MADLHAKNLGIGKEISHETSFNFNCLDNVINNDIKKIDFLNPLENPLNKIKW